MERTFYKRCLPGMIVVISTFIINTNTLPKKQYHRLAAKAAIPMPNVTYNQLLLNKIQQKTMPHITAWGFIQGNRNINFLLVCICPVSSGDNTLPKSQVWDFTFFFFFHIQLFCHGCNEIFTTTFVRARTCSVKCRYKHLKTRVHRKTAWEIIACKT